MMDQVLAPHPWRVKHGSLSSISVVISAKVSCDLPAFAMACVVTRRRLMRPNESSHRPYR